MGTLRAPGGYLWAKHAIFGVMLAWSLVAVGHTTRLSSSTLTVRGVQVVGTLEVNGHDLEVASSVTLRGLSGAVAPSLLESNRAKLSTYLSTNLRLEQSEGKRCAGQIGEFAVKEDRVIAEVRWQCAPGDRALVLVVGLFQEIDPASQHMVTVTGDVRKIALLGVTDPKLDLREPEPKLGAVLLRYFFAGVEHIGIGYDHIAFVIAVVLWGRRFGPLAAVVTAFTVAHSVTLSLAVLDIVRLPSKLAELMIALSIMYVAAENFFVRDIGRRWILTFLFGLVHGFGFAAALREYGMPKDKVGWALGSFNVGIEVGQLVIVSIALVLLLAADARMGRVVAGSVTRRNPVVVWTISAGIFLLALLWAWERTVDWLT